MRPFIPLAIAIILGGAGAAAAQKPSHGKPHGNGQVFVWQGGFGKGRLGVQIQDITDELRQFFGAGKGQGVLVGRVDKDTPAARAGVQVGDVIVSVAGQPVDHSMDVSAALSGKKKGDAVDLVVVRGKQRVTLKATMADDPSAADAFGNFDVMIPDLGDLDDLKNFEIQPFGGGDPKMKEQLERMEKQLRELEKKLQKLQK